MSNALWYGRAFLLRTLQLSATSANHSRASVVSSSCTQVYTVLMLGQTGFINRLLVRPCLESQARLEKDKGFTSPSVDLTMWANVVRSRQQQNKHKGLQSNYTTALTNDQGDFKRIMIKAAQED